MIKIVSAIAGLFGFSLSPIIAGLVISVIITGAIGFYTHFIYQKGKASCEYAHLLATIKEQKRQMAEIEAIQKSDADRAAKAEEALQKLKEKIDATPENPTSCSINPDTINRIQPAGGVSRERGGTKTNR